MPTPSINFNWFCYVLNILLPNRLGKAVPEMWYFPLCLYKGNRLEKARWVWEKKNGILYQLKPPAGLLMEDECLRHCSWVAWKPKEREHSLLLACRWASLRVEGSPGWAVAGQEGVAAEAGSPSSGCPCAAGCCRAAACHLPVPSGSNPCLGSRGGGVGK